MAVLGAGLQGACVALELASRGVDVDLFDKNALAVSQASAQNEAKIHLGFFYGNDPTLKTARLLARAAVNFPPLLRRWIGADVDRIPSAPPYYYAVQKDSLVSVEDIERHLQATSNLLNQQTTDGVDYFGVDFRQPPCRLSGYDELFNPETIVAAFRTPEVAISAESLATFVRGHLATEPNIRCILCATVRRVTLHDTNAEVEFDLSGNRCREGYDHVINALWDGRLAVDATLGIKPARPWLFRLKYNVHVASAPVHPGVPSVSVVLGAFGDVVRYGNGEMYLSWYPAGLRAMSSDLAPDWPLVLDAPTAQQVREQTFAALTNIVPALADLAPYCLLGSEVRGGVIFAWGQTDISDPGSDLHARFDIGPRSYGRYHSIDTGKLTTAPLFAKMMADRILSA